MQSLMTGKRERGIWLVKTNDKQVASGFDLVDCMAKIQARRDAQTIRVNGVNHVVVEDSFLSKMTAKAKEMIPMLDKFSQPQMVERSEVAQAIKRGFSKLIGKTQADLVKQAIGD